MTPPEKEGSKENLRSPEKGGGRVGFPKRRAQKMLDPCQRKLWKKSGEGSAVSQSTNMTRRTQFSPQKNFTERERTVQRKGGVFEGRVVSLKTRKGSRLEGNSWNLQSEYLMREGRS